MPDFHLWLEFESWADDRPFDATNDFCNIAVTFRNGTRCALNVWTFRYFDEALREQRNEGGTNLLYLVPPDLFVERLDRAVLEQVITALIREELLGGGSDGVGSSPLRPGGEEVGP